MPKISALTSLAQASVDTAADVLPIVDATAPATTKKVTVQAMVNAGLAAAAPQGGTFALTGALATSGLITIDANAGTLPTGLTGTILHVGNADSTTTRILVDSFGANGAITFRRSNGTAAAPTNLIADQAIGAFFGFGYGATGYSSSGRVGVSLLTTEIWTDSAQGAYIQFSTTPTGGTATQSSMEIEAGGRVKTRTKISPGTDAGAYQTACGLYAGTGAPSNANGADGDFYFRSDGGALTTVYQRRAGTWTGIV